MAAGAKRGINPDSPLARLIAGPMRPGRLVWIGLRPARRAALVSVERAQITVEAGLVGDHYTGRPGGPRQVTLIQAEDLAAIAGFLGRDDPVSPFDLRRNLVVTGINLLGLSDKRFRIGCALLEATGGCHPCSRMNEILGEGGYNAVRGRGGLTARVIEGGEIVVGDAVAVEG
ncbi:MOSC domain-containing protein [Caulobacter zeae]|uniref:MOSC domain-containing protein n=1 Tax=Caulobacter zeae TaxID=2055137 RepID=A0A2N5DQV3_9CAUL|nr:MOSC domain-containing protein [Caulobacter zeae]PLR28429.1 MOSC domain-containing protein [Caulobacter zeae]